MKKPLIGITCNALEDIADTLRVGIGAPGQAWQLIADDYVHAVHKAGGVPLLIPVCEKGDCVESALEAVDGLLISGGNDLNPMLYGERIGKYCGALDIDRDEIELDLARRAIDRDMPLLCVCRGMQVLNVALGGTLYQDLPSSGFEPHSIAVCARNVPTHDVLVEKNSPLFEIFGEAQARVNSFHHQAVRDVASTLSRAAVSRDGVVEAIFMRDKKFVLATQWHPEMMYDNEKQQGIFTAFVSACG